jgi:RimJ/RimL family protein N-acetyltransferase
VECEFLEPSINLRPLAETDLPTYLRWRNDPDVTKYLARPQMSADDARAWFEQPGSHRRYGIELNGTLVGYGIIDSIDTTNRKCEVGVVIGNKGSWGKGFGRTAARELTRIAINELGLHRVLAVASAENPASIACFKAAGFREEGRLRDGYYREGRFIDLVLLSVLSTECGK